MKNKISFVTGINSRKAGGLFFTICSVTNKLCTKAKIEILGFKDYTSFEDMKEYDERINVVFYKVFLNKLLKIGLTFDLHQKLVNFKPDIIHQQGIWLYFSRVVSKYKKNNNVKVVIQPHGMLDQWAIQNSFLKKKIVSFFYEKNNLEKADCLHALNIEEYKSIRELGYLNPIAIIPNGIEIPQIEDSSVKKSNILLYIGRIHPKKGLELLIDALFLIKSQSENILKEWVVRIGGWDQNNHEAHLKNKVKEYGLEDIVCFIGPVFNQLKEKELRMAKGFVLPSYSEGLPMTILEAWSYGLPTIMTEKCNLNIGFDKDAAIKISLDSTDIATKLIHFFNLSDQERNQIGINGYKLVQERFTWDQVAFKTELMYNWLLGKADKPEFVILE